MLLCVAFFAPFSHETKSKWRPIGGEEPVPDSTCSTNSTEYFPLYFFFYKFSTLIWKKTQVNRTGEKGETFICYSAGRSQSRAGRQRAAVGGAFSKYWNALLSGTPIFSPLPLVHSCCEGLTEIGKFVVTEWEAEMTS